ncbi:MAG: HD domain-containing protein, partial [Asgard group archaeon]|nr:HD domain-containing protein [Asgard group archaeon]
AFKEVCYDKVLVVPVDMPNLTREILQALIKELDNSWFVAPYSSSLRKVEPLVYAFKADHFIHHSELLSAIHTTRADDIHRIFEHCTFLAFTKQIEDYLPKIFENINTLEDLRNFSKIKIPTNSSIYNKTNSIIIQKERDLDLLSSLIKLFSKMDSPFSSKTISHKHIVKIVDLLVRKKYFLYAIKLLQKYYMMCIDVNNSEKNNQKKRKSILQKLFSITSTEQQYWEKKHNELLAYHTIMDLISFCQKYNSVKNESLQKLLTFKRVYEERLNLNKKPYKTKSIENLLSNRLPSLLPEIHSVLQKAEITFNKKSPVYETDFLWNHTFRVAKIAYFLAQREGIDPLIPTLSALFHDTGKFVLGDYHKNDVPEETYSASIAKKLLEKHNFAPKKIEEITRILSLLYRDDVELPHIAKIVLDADRLDKLGALGIANFFTKGALRGQSLNELLLNSLSKELSYSYTAPKTMQTKTGREIAKIRKERTIEFYRQLLEELSFFGIKKYIIRKIPYKNTHLLILIPESCHRCQGNFSLQLSTKEGIKCQKIIATFKCTSCDEKFEVAFCSPVIIE